MAGKTPEHLNAMREASRAAPIGGGIHRDAVKGPDGISKAARDASPHGAAALESVLRNNPGLAEQIRKDGTDMDALRRAVTDPREIQRGYDAIHSGTGGRSDGRGQVYRDAPATQREKAANAQYWSNRARNHDVRGDGPADTTKTRPAARQNGVSAFEKADQSFRAKRDAGSSAEQGDASGVAKGKRGFGNPANQAAAQKAKGNNYKGPSE